jgi:hypothetical protein
MMMATATTISVPATTVRRVIVSFRNTTPSSTAPTGVTYA